MNDNDKKRLKKNVKKELLDNYDLIDIDSEIDSSLTYEENYNIIHDKYKMYMNDIVSMKQEFMEYERSLLDSIPMDDDAFIKLMQDIHSVLGNKNIKTIVKSKLIKDAIDKLEQIEHLKDVKREKLSKLIKDYAERYGVW